MGHQISANHISKTISKKHYIQRASAGLYDLVTDRTSSSWATLLHSLDLGSRSLNFRLSVCLLPSAGDFVTPGLFLGRALVAGPIGSDSGDLTQAAGTWTGGECPVLAAS